MYFGSMVYIFLLVYISHPEVLRSYPSSLPEDHSCEDFVESNIVLGLTQNGCMQDKHFSHCLSL